MVRNGSWQRTALSIPRPMIPLDGASSSGICWVFSGAAETVRDLEGWHGEEDHTNNTGKAMLAAHVFIQYLQEATGWQARYEAPIQRLRDGTESDDSRPGVAPLLNPRKK